MKILHQIEMDWDILRPYIEIDNDKKVKNVNNIYKYFRSQQKINFINQTNLLRI